jgi:hypothetical protein
MGFPQAIRRAYNSAIEGSADAIARGANRVGGQAPMRGALAGNPVGVMEEARKTLMAAYQSAKPAGKKALQKFLDDPEAFTALPEQVIERLARGDVSAVADAARFTSFPGRTAGQWVPPEGGIYSPEAMALGAGTAGAVGVGIAAGGAVANPKPSSPADLSDGLTGAPQDDITPEPVAGEARPSPQAAPLPPSRQARPGDTPLAPPEVMTQADIDYVNSLPQNSPEAMLRKAKRWDKSDRRMEDFEYRLREQLGADISEAELESLRNGGVPPSFDPGSLGDDERLPSVISARPQSYSNPNTFDPMAQADPRQAFRDFERAEDMRRRSQGAPVEAQRERDFASGQYGDFDQRLQDQSSWAKSMQIDPEGRGFGPTDFQRRYNPKESREWYDQNVVPRIREQARTSELTGETYNSAEEKIAADQSARAKDPEYQERADLANMRARATMDAKSLGMTYEQVISEFDEYAALRGKQSTRDKRFAQRRLNNLNERDAEQDLRRERLATRGLYGLNQAQANAYVALGDPNLSDEQRLAAEYTLNPRKFMVDYATAQNPPKGDESQLGPLAQGQSMLLQQQQADAAVAAGEKAGREGRRNNPNDSIGRERQRSRISKQYAGNPVAQAAALAAFDAAWPEEGDPNRTPAGGPRGAGIPTLPSGAPLPGVM